MFRKYIRFEFCVDQVVNFLCLIIDSLLKFHVEYVPPRICSLAFLVPLTISYHLYFLRISKVLSKSHYGLVGRVHSKECYLIFTYTFLAFLFCFSSKNLCLYHFHIFVIKYRISATEY